MNITRRTLISLASLGLFVGSFGGCHAEIRDPGPLAKACAHGNGHFECQVQTVIRALEDAYAETGWHNQRPAKFTTGAGILTGILVNYRCGVPHSVETPYGTYLLNVGDVTLADYTTVPATYYDTTGLFQLMPKGVQMKQFQHFPIAGAVYSPANAMLCDKYGMDYYSVESVNGFSIPPVTYRPTPTPKPEE